MAASNRFEYSHTESTVQVTSAVTVPQLIQLVNNRISKWGELLVPILINIYVQSWRPSSNIGAGIVWCSGFCKIFNTTSVSDNAIFSVLDITSYDDNYTNYVGRIFYGKKNDTTYANSKIEWIKS